jgi:hypothetical protein
MTLSGALRLEADHCAVGDTKPASDVMSRNQEQLVIRRKHTLAVCHNPGLWYGPFVLSLYHNVWHKASPYCVLLLILPRYEAVLTGTGGLEGRLTWVIRTMIVSDLDTCRKATVVSGGSKDKPRAPMSTSNVGYWNYYVGICNFVVA